jgi:2-dehydro-3-deoxyphosphogluconate aldolase / (4S)-4-hydroxy-2-oxoglutarate aldolase
MPDISNIMTLAPVIPVLVIERAEDAVQIAEALVEGGLPVLEVTLRTPAALEAIRLMSQVEGAVVGAGTILGEHQLNSAAEAGATFAVSPGLTESLARAAKASGLPFLPGTANAGDIMRALEFGFDRLKFFPAMTSGGLPALSSLASVFGDVRFCPTGGISQDNAASWLAHPKVDCVGGSWLVPAGEAIDPAAIRERAKQASQLSAMR